MGVNSAVKAGPATSRVGDREPFEASTAAEREFLAVYQRIRRRALAFARAFVDRDTALDVFHDVALGFYRKWEQLPLEKRTDAMLLMAVHNTALNRQKREERLVEFDESGHSAPQLLVPSVDEATGQIDGKDILDPIVDRLPPQQRAVWLLRRQGLSYEEIGNQLGIKHRTVARHIQEATQSVRAGIERAGLRIARESALRMIPPRTGERTDV